MYDVANDGPLLYPFPSTHGMGFIYRYIERKENWTETWCFWWCVCISLTASNYCNIAMYVRTLNPLWIGLKLSLGLLIYIKLGTWLFARRCCKNKVRNWGFVANSCYTVSGEIQTSNLKIVIFYILVDWIMHGLIVACTTLYNNRNLDGLKAVFDLIMVPKCVLVSGLIVA